MGETIWKYELEAKELQYVDVPSQHRVLSIAEQGDKMCMWVMVNPSSERQRRLQVNLVGTGWDVPSDVGFDYYTSVVVQGGTFVWHYFVKAL